MLSPGVVVSLAQLPSKLCTSSPSPPSSSPDPEIEWWSLAWRALKPPGGGWNTIRVTLVGWAQSKLCDWVSIFSEIILDLLINPREIVFRALLLAKRRRPDWGLMPCFGGDKGQSSTREVKPFSEGLTILAGASPLQPDNKWCYDLQQQGRKFRNSLTHDVFHITPNRRRFKKIGVETKINFCMRFPFSFKQTGRDILKVVNCLTSMIKTVYT